MDKSNVIESLSFGSRIAEDEIMNLSKYFVGSRFWNNLKNGSTDVILGAKGSGKSALYLYLLSNKVQFAQEKIFLNEAENPRGDTIFGLFSKVTTNKEYESPQKEALIENDIIGFWQLYFLVLIVSGLKERKFDGSNYKNVLEILEECGLLPQTVSLKGIFRHVIFYLKQIVTLKFFQPEIEIDPNTGSLSGIKGKIVFDEPSPSKSKVGFCTIEDLFEKINLDLQKKEEQIWILLDRLDVAFQDDATLEKRALKALFTVYNSLKSCDSIKLKIFLRDDIWGKITLDGMREASHITRKEVIMWDSDSLFNLLMKRVVGNENILTFLDIKDNSPDSYKKIFSLIFPDSVNNKPFFDWVMEQLVDGSEKVAPRELIHLFTESRETQL